MNKPLWNRCVLANEPRNEWAKRFYLAAASTGRLYRNIGHGLTYITLFDGPQKILTSGDFYGLAHNIIEIIQPREDRERGLVNQPVALTESEIRILFASSEQTVLPLLRAVVNEPVVVATKNGFRTVDPGYTPDLGCYYWVPPGTMPIKPRSGTEHLEKCFSAVPFAAPGFRNNLLAWLLGGIYLHTTADTPLLVINGNQQGVGKSSCIQAAGYILSGSLPAPIDFRGGEFMKGLSARFIENDRVMVMDNIVTGRGRSFDNPQLSALLTQGPSKKIRVLGHSRTVSATGILFAASLNDAKLSSDLSDRSLLVKLHREINCPMSPYCKEYAIKYRDELYGELLGLALLNPPGIAPTLFTNFRFRHWLEFVAPRIRAAGLGELAIEETSSLDDVTQELGHFGADRTDVLFTSDDFVTQITREEFKFPALAERFGNIVSERGKKSSATQLLNARSNKFFEPAVGVKLRLIRSQNQGTFFVFREVQDVPA